MSNHRESVPQALGVVRGLILSCFLIRFFDVAESAGQGETLWIVVLWLIGLILTVGLAVKWPVQLWRPEWLDWGVGLLVAGQILSAIVVVATSGDKRTAVNLAWEWVGIGVAWLMLRQQSLQSAFRRELVAGL